MPCTHKYVRRENKLNSMYIKLNDDLKQEPRGGNVPDIAICNEGKLFIWGLNILNIMV